MTAHVHKLALASVAVGILVLGLKYVAYYLTGSIALYSDALESGVNIVTAMAALMATWTSAKPADSDHPYGHHKAEYLSAVLTGVLIVLASLSILREAFLGFVDPRQLEAPWPGLLVNAIASVINGAWCWILIRHGRKHHSPALVADGHHLLGDVVTSVGVLAGLLLAELTGWPRLDPALAALVALNILWSGWRVLRTSVAGLMDEAVPTAALARIRELISSNARGAIEAHDLRTRQAGRRTFIDLHLVVPGGMSVSGAHDICDRIEHALKAEIGDALITIHVEPDDKAEHAGIIVH